MHIPFIIGATRYTTITSVDDKDEVEEKRIDGAKGIGFSFKRHATIFAQVYTILSFVAASIFVTIMLFRTIFSSDTLDTQHNRALGPEGAVSIHRSYGRDERYMSLDHKYDHLWSRWGEKANILVPDELNAGKKVPAAISMYHQMHCLRSLRVALQDAHEGKPVVLDWHSDHHWPHCFDYLRSSILCWADDTYETQAIQNGTRSPIITGEADIRQCRRPELLYELVQKWSLSDDGRSGR